MATTLLAGEWLPRDAGFVSGYMKKIIKEAYGIKDLDDKKRAHPPPQLLQFHSYVDELKDLIEKDPEVNMLFTNMFTENPQDPDPGSRVRNYTEMLILINYISTTAPSFSGVHVPINALFKYPMATPSGTTAFLNERVNKCFRNILKNWARFLDSPNSRYVLDRSKQDSWLSDAALAKMGDFKSTYEIDESDEKYWGFKSWNDFFARKLKPGARPVSSGDDQHSIVAACESTPYRIKKGSEVQLYDTFWIKTQPYSLKFMLNNDPLAETYVGGTVYQYFLSTYNYHRWHVPVDGTIQKACVAEGAYYAEALSVGFDPTADTESQSYLSNVANRAIIFIKADAPDIGVVAVVMIGMAEIASILIDVYEGQKVKKGDPLGMFQYGGSSYLMCFQKDVGVQFKVNTIPANPALIKVNTRVAQV